MTDDGAGVVYKILGRRARLAWQLYIGQVRARAKVYCIRQERGKMEIFE